MKLFLILQWWVIRKLCLTRVIPTKWCMTYPLIGNYGMTDEDYETKVPTMGGLIVREYNDLPSNFRYTKTLDEVLVEYDIPAISGVDTRMITRIIRDEGSQSYYLQRRCTL